MPAFMRHAWKTLIPKPYAGHAWHATKSVQIVPSITEEATRCPEVHKAAVSRKVV